MKIKNKLIAGGLMSVVACALVGSITGTFAWYQVSNKSTVSIHGTSVGTTKNLEVSLDNGSTWRSGNITWLDIAKALGKADAQATSADALKMAPLSNGANDGSSDLNKTTDQTPVESWYSNPDGGKDLPVVNESAKNAANGGYIQFSFKARYHEVVDGVDSYPASKIYITNIGAKSISGTANVSNALRVHVDFVAKQCIFNPFKAAPENVTLSATLDSQYDTEHYDWETASAQTWQLPQDRYTAADEQADSTHVEGTYKSKAGVLSSLAHEDVLATVKDDGSLNEGSSYYAVSSANTGVVITVTAWLEGFAKENASAASNWWATTTTIGTDLQFGFQLSAFKD